jgi:3-dehydroquinate dehydratase/shikimate dehydrogenase
MVVQVVACDSMDEALRAYRQADRRADVVEFRLDRIRRVDPDRLAAARGRPKLLTIRSRAQGGGSPQSERRDLLRRIVSLPVEYIDLELGDEELPCLDSPGGPRRILSHHVLDATPLDLGPLLARMRAVPRVALFKIVTFAEVATDNLRIRDLLRGQGDGSLAAFCMGAKGVPSRVLSALWGSAAIYAPRRGDRLTAPGQVTLEALFDTYRFLDIARDTRLFGVLGNPIGHSLSPPMHNAAFQALDLDLRYLPFEASTLAEFLPLLADLRLAGLSVTIPYKERFLPHLERLDAASRRAGAVNTVIKRWNRLEGYNSDTAAALSPLRGRIRLRGARVAVLGAGGAARALIDGLRRRGARVTIFNRTKSRGTALAERFGARHLPWHRARCFPCDLLVNATPVGMAPDITRSPIPGTWVAAPLVYDMIYNPPETRFLRLARRRGATVLGGLDMFLAQGARQFELFTGRRAPLPVMRRAVVEALGGGNGPAENEPPPRGDRARRPSPGGTNDVVKGREKRAGR